MEETSNKGNLILDVNEKPDIDKFFKIVKDKCSWI